MQKKISEHSTESPFKFLTIS